MDGAASPATATSVRAPAKVNLSLHVVGRRDDCYHLLDGLVVFAGIADELTIAEAEADHLRVAGPMAPSLSDGDNILDRTLAFARGIAAGHGVEIGPLAIRLEKRLPVAAGIGGGSSDSAALLRWLADRHLRLQHDLRRNCASLGADVPMCFDAKPCRIRGIGEAIEPLPRIPALPMVLANPGVAVPTPVVFKTLRSGANAGPPPLPVDGFREVEDVVDYLAGCRNDLEAPAIRIAPAIEEALDALRASGAKLARMSGSGATVFGLYDTNARAAEAAAFIGARRPGWWVAATRSEGTA